MLYKLFACVMWVCVMNCLYVFMFVYIMKCWCYDVFV